MGITDEADQTFQAEKLQTIIKAANVEDVEAIWTTLFAKVRALVPMYS